MLAARPPFVSDGVGDLLAMHIKEAPPPLRQFADVSPELAHLVHSMLAKSPEDRPPMHAVAKALRGMGRSQSAAPSGALPADERATVRQPAGTPAPPVPSTAPVPASAQTPGSAVTPVPMVAPSEAAEPLQTERSSSSLSASAAPSVIERAPAAVEVQEARADGFPEAKTQPLLRVALGSALPPTAPRLDLSQFPTLHPGLMKRESTPAQAVEPSLPPPPSVPGAPSGPSLRSRLRDRFRRASPSLRIAMSLTLLALLSVAVALSYFLARAG